MKMRNSFSVRKRRQHRPAEKALKIISLLLCALFFLTLSRPVWAGTVYENSENGYRVDIDDEASLLTEEEKTELAAKMQPLTAYGHIAFVSTNENADTAEDYARDYYTQHYASSSGSLFLVYMDNRYIYIFSRGFNYTVITTSRAETITDNIYTYARGGDYYGCAVEAYAEMLTILEGGKIAQPMKYISNALLALIMSLLIFFFIVRRSARIQNAALNEILNKAEIHANMQPPMVKFTGQTKRYSPIDTGSGGGGGGGGGGSSGGGGGGGGGGGHSF